MRSITRTLHERLKAQSEEAKLLKLEKAASGLDSMITKYAENVRGHNEFYSYAKAELNEDVNKALWDAAIRVVDYLGAPVDAKQIQASVDKMTSDLIDEIMVSAGVEDGVGAYEPTVPGEERQHAIIEVEDTE